jgi:hypothetical protein
VGSRFRGFEVPRRRGESRCLVNDDERATRIQGLLLRFSQATARKAALESETREFESRLGEIRAAHGNPYFYSGVDLDPLEHADDSIANYTGDKAHEPGRRIARGLLEVNLELSIVTEQLRALGVNVE